MSNQNQPLVYFFGKSNFGDTMPDFIKIGYTGTELSLRKAALQTGCESLIWVMGVLPFEAEDEARREERRIHDHFGGSQARGEWFYATPRIIQYIEDYAVQYTELFIEDVPPTSGKEVIEPDLDPTRSEDAMVFGEWLRECRNRNEPNMTQAEVAGMVGYSRGYISFIEQGRGMPGKELHDALIHLFGDPADSTMEIKSKILAVRMEDGTWIAEDRAIDTFIEVIKVLGIERVKNLGLSVNGIPLIADCVYDGKAQRKIETEARTYYIVSGTNTVTKKSILDDIADRLNDDITVFANPRA